MKRRDPTRIELKLDDIQEYEQMKRDLEMQQKEKEGTAESEANTDMMESTGPGNNAGAKSRAETIHRRIGYDPAPKNS